MAPPSAFKSGKTALETELSSILATFRSQPELQESKLNTALGYYQSLMPHLGQFSATFQLIYDIAYNAIYSSEVTSDETGAVRRVPYFCLTSRVFSERDVKADELTAQLEVLKERLFSKHADYESLESANSALRERLEEREASIDELEGDVAKLEETLNDAKQHAADESAFYEDRIRAMEREMGHLKEDLNESNKIVVNYTKYKKMHDDLDLKFSKWNVDLDSKPVIKGSVAASLEEDVNLADNVEKQLFSLQNELMTNFDAFVNFRPKAEAFDDLIVHAKVAYAKDVTFASTMERLTNELGLLSQQRERLNFALVSSKSPDAEGNLFVPNEPLLSKFALGLFTSSDDGKSYYEFPGSKACQSCSARVLVCPHLFLGRHRVLKLPHHTTHLKLTRPLVKFTSQILAYSQAPGSRASSARPYVPPGSRPTTAGSEQSAKSEEGSLYKGADLTSNCDFSGLWADFSIRSPVLRVIRRDLSQEEIYALIEAFLVYLVKQEQLSEKLVTDIGFKPKFDPAAAVLDHLYRFFLGRYHNNDIAFLAAADFIHGLIQGATAGATNHMDMVEKDCDLFLFLFAHVLCGRLNIAIVKYLVLVGEAIGSIDWKFSTDYIALASLLYPWLDDDDLDTVQINFVSWTENYISTEIVWQYLLFTTLKWRELRVVTLTEKLSKVTLVEANFMTEAEFTTACNVVAPLSPEWLRRYIHQEIEHAASEGAVSVLLATQGACYLDLFGHIDVVKEKLWDAVLESRNDPENGRFWRWKSSEKQAVQLVGVSKRVFGRAQLVSMTRIRSESYYQQKIDGYKARFNDP